MIPRKNSRRDAGFSLCLCFNRTCSENIDESIDIGGDVAGVLMMSSLYSLVAVAESAQKIAAGLNEFLDAVPERSTEITGLISECFAISSALRELSNAIRDPLYYHRFELIREDVSIVGQSLDYTFQDVDRRFGGLRTATYHQVWREMDTHFKNESRNTLVTRLEYYRSFLLRLLHLITGLVLP